MDDIEMFLLGMFFLLTFAIGITVGSFLERNFPYESYEDFCEEHNMEYQYFDDRGDFCIKESGMNIIAKPIERNEEGKVRWIVEESDE